MTSTWLERRNRSRWQLPQRAETPDQLRHHQRRSRRDLAPSGSSILRLGEGPISSTRGATQPEPGNPLVIDPNGDSYDVQPGPPATPVRQPTSSVSSHQT